MACGIGGAIYGRTIYGFKGDIAVDASGTGKCSAGHLKLAHHDAQHGVEDLFFADGGVHLARGFKKGLKTRHLLLQLKGVATGDEMGVCGHDDPRGI
jgi:hypothetical protein